MNAQLHELLPPVGTAVAEYSQTEAGLAELRQQIADASFDCTTPAGDREARQTRMTLVKLRTSLEDKRKELKAPLVERGRLIDAEAKRITGEIVALEMPIDELIRAEETRREAARAERERIEAERLAAVNAQIERIRALPLTYVAATAAVLQEAIAEVSTMDCAATFDETHAPRAEQAKEAALAGLQRALDARLAADAEAERLAAERAELERLRAEQAEAQRIADERAKAERAEADRLAKIERDRLAAEQAERERIAREQREAEAAVARAEQERIAAAQRAEQERLDAERAELARQQADARKAAEKAAQQKAAKDAKKKADDEAKAIEKASLVGAASAALALLEELGQSEHLTTRMLAAAIARADGDA